MADRSMPSSLRGLRACMCCSLIKTGQQFEKHGCDNCPFLNLEQDQERVLERTTTQFNGMIALMDPDESWVARWQRINGSNKYVRGCYAISVNGTLPEEAIDLMERQGLQYISREQGD